MSIEINRIRSERAVSSLFESTNDLIAQNGTFGGFLEQDSDGNIIIQNSSEGYIFLGSDGSMRISNENGRTFVRESGNNPRITNGEGAVIVSVPRSFDGSVALPNGMTFFNGATPHIENNVGDSISLSRVRNGAPRILLISDGNGSYIRSVNGEVISTTLSQSQIQHTSFQTFSVLSGAVFTMLGSIILVQIVIAMIFIIAFRRKNRDIVAVQDMGQYSDGIIDRDNRKN